MGANMVNTVAEAVAGRLAELASARVGLRILSNLSDRRMVRVSCRVPFTALVGEKSADSGAVLAREIEAASRFAEDDIYRAATHNKGIMNGVDPVVIATGNDWRGIEAGAHAYAARDGRYQPLSTWRVKSDGLVGHLAMPMAVGTVGGTLQIHPGARLALRILGGPRRASWPKSSAASAWHKTLPRSKPWPAKASSAATWHCIDAPWGVVAARLTDAAC
jgi:hydroxymethylglutaryl-CoA reductase